MFRTLHSRVRLNLASSLSLRHYRPSCTNYAEWTLSHMRKMRKPALVKVAQDYDLDTSGTKNELIERILAYNRGDRNMDNVDGPEHVLAEQWVKAFDTKVAQRGSRTKASAWRDTRTSAPRVAQRHPHHITEKEAVTPASPSYDAEEEIIFEHALSDKAMPEDSDIDLEWVQAFDKKVGNRGARQNLEPDTLTPFTPDAAKTVSSAMDVEGLDFIRVDEKDEDPRQKLKEVLTDPIPKQVKQDQEQAQSQAPAHDHHQSTHKSQHESKTDEQQSEGSARNWIINTAIGSGILIWVTSGAEGFKKIATFLS
ncbi:uncharacterized protein BYT42DRAFT_489088 [Radiomyces spectabilis]|uniref:uncharacterized protein n=1 Tax=Radiomyces spectabilis TaxID=64574 RepID=UPI002220FC7D|nr:uncharacterized protein BYT42DRAFT_489088 [Radiomyces spectabilis]KAI8390840.1 hypothetical protein BYT42DRAFT_489088 [Radiomyces spectabilis]